MVTTKELPDNQERRICFPDSTEIVTSKAGEIKVKQCVALTT